MSDLPTGTVTFLFTDIEGSTRLWEEQPEAMQEALARHDALLRGAIEARGGAIFKTMGDQFCAAFTAAPAALAASLEAQCHVQAEPWGDMGPLRVRMALHTGAVEARAGDYFGAALNRVARLLQAAHGGQVLLSQLTRDLTSASLPEGAGLRDLGEQRLRDLSRPERIFQLLHPSLPAEFPPLRSLGVHAHNLPIQLTSFVGREREIREIKQLLARSRLLTLTGAGGCGKTRLALQVSAELLEQYPDGVWLLELAPLTDPSLVLRSLVEVLGVPEPADRPLIQSLVEWLRPKRLLLVLDNCEHLVAASAELVETLLRSCPELRVLASSREALGVAGETAWRVPSLPVPDPAEPASLESLREFQSAQLFIERARSAQPSFELTARNAPAVAQVCCRLDGLPLAIELAAARVKVLSVEQIEQRMGDWFRLLTGGSRTALPRQQTLRATIDWSYDLLTEPERALLRRLSVFAGGCTLEAVEQVCVGNPVEEWEILDLLARLVDKSLVIADETGGQARYRLLETIRQYSRDRLLERGEAAAVRDRHLACFLDVAERAEPEMEGPELVAWLDRLETEHDNLRAALEWSRGREDGGVALLRLAGSLRKFWLYRDHQSEGREWSDAALAAGGEEAPGALRAKALEALGLISRGREALEASLSLYRELGDEEGICRSLAYLAFDRTWRGELQEAEAIGKEALALARQTGNRYLEGFCLWRLGAVANRQEDDSRAFALLEEAANIGRRFGNPFVLAWIAFGLAQLAWRRGEGERAGALLAESEGLFRRLGSRSALAHHLEIRGFQGARRGEGAASTALLEECLAIRRKLNDRPGIAGTLLVMGHAARWQGDDLKARALYEECLALARELDLRTTIAWALCNLTLVRVRQGEPEPAAVLARESLALWHARESEQEMESLQGVARCLEGLALVAWAQRRPGRTARLFGAAEALREAVKWPLPSVDELDYAVVPAVRVALGDAAFAAAWAEGRAMPREEAITYALSEDFET